MKFVKPFMVFALAAFMASSAVANDGKNISYSMKKQGRVHFQDKTQDQIVTKDAADTAHPADIEPAAGYSEAAVNSSEPSIAERIRLPRKN